MNVMKLQELLTMKFEGDHARIARMQHFASLLKTGIDGMATLGVIINIEVEGIETTLVQWAEPSNILSSLEVAIDFMQQASKNA